MSGFLSTTALLGLLAVAGYQNRDKIADMLSGLGSTPNSNQGGNTPSAPNQTGGVAGVLNQLSNSLGTAATPGGILGGGLAELLDKFKQAGHGEAAESWVRSGPNQPVSPTQLQQAIGPDILDALSRQTGLSQTELLARLSRDLPDAVDRYTPDGRLPSQGEFLRT